MQHSKALVVTAALYGAAGVVLLAVGSHAAGGLATTAGQVLLFHAPALLGGALALKLMMLNRGLGRIGLALIALGSALFAGDLALRAFTGYRLFPYAAPAGGFAMIAGWLVLTLAALAVPRGR